MISVCMATYNGEKNITEQIYSILCQIGEDDELIISDDWSTDNTFHIIQSIQDNRITLIRNNGIHGYTSNFYNALKFAKGDYIFLSDQDDIWLPNKVGITVAKLQKYAFVVSDAKEVNQNLTVISDSRIKKYRMKSGFINNLLRSRYIGCCMAFTKDVLKKIFPVPTYTNNFPHDLWIALIGEFYFKSALIEEPLILYRRHESNTSDGGEGKKGNLYDILCKVGIRFYYFFFVIKQSLIKNN